MHFCKQEMTLDCAQCYTWQEACSSCFIMFRWVCEHMQHLHKNLKTITPDVVPFCRYDQVMIASFKASKDPRVIFVFPFRNLTPKINPHTCPHRKKTALDTVQRQQFSPGPHLAAKIIDDCMEGDEGLHECRTDRQKEIVMTPMLTEKERDRTKENMSMKLVYRLPQWGWKSRERREQRGKIKWRKIMALRWPL